MRRAWWLLLLVLPLSGCSGAEIRRRHRSRRAGSRRARGCIYNSGVGDTLWSICDRGNLIYMTEKVAQVAVVPNGCPHGQP